MKPEQLKNIIPLYLGQKVEYFDDDINGDFHSCVSTIDKISTDGEIELSDGIVLIGLGGFGEKDFLLLRPLSSMTEEEARGICDVMGWELKNAMFYKSGVRIYISSYDRVDLYDNGDIAFQDEFPMSLIPHLCSLGFDCFGLIQAGIAKDVMKIKTPQKVTYEVKGVSLTTGGEKVFVFNEAEYKEFQQKRDTHYPAWRFTKTEKKQS